MSEFSPEGYRRPDKTEFGGGPGMARDWAEDGAVESGWEQHNRMIRTDPMNPEDGTDIITERVV